jgi:hypothetical protein
MTVRRSRPSEEQDMSFFSFPEDGHWASARGAVAFSVVVVPKVT